MCKTIRFNEILNFVLCSAFWLPNEKKINKIELNRLIAEHRTISTWMYEMCLCSNGQLATTVATLPTADTDKPNRLYGISENILCIHVIIIFILMRCPKWFFCCVLYAVFLISMSICLVCGAFIRSLISWYYEFLFFYLFTQRCVCTVHTNSLYLLEIDHIAGQKSLLVSRSMLGMATFYT